MKMHFFYKIYLPNLYKPGRMLLKYELEEMGKDVSNL